MSYSVYTRAYDEIIHARDLIANVVSALPLDRQSAMCDAIARHAVPDVDDRTTLVDGCTRPVTILIDMSGSMRGYRTQRVVQSLIRIGHLMEAAGQPFEVLGFTTASWKGGRCREDWVAAGRPQTPGRLNELRHIVIKAFDERWADQHALMGVMVLGSTLKENVDGEALEWAVSRMPASGRDDGTLLLISDGVPHDDATVSVNPASLLKDHALEAVGKIHRSGIPFHCISLDRALCVYDGSIFVETGRASSETSDLSLAIAGALADLEVGCTDPLATEPTD